MEEAKIKGLGVLSQTSKVTPLPYQGSYVAVSTKSRKNELIATESGGCLKPPSQAVVTLDAGKHRFYNKHFRK